MDMERKKAYLYDAFGELIYLVAMADGLIQEEEVKALEDILGNHPWAKEIQWSFNYEASKNNNPEDTYKKVIMACHDYGPNPEFQFMIEVMEAVAKASAGIDQAEQAKMDQFVQDLTGRFKADIEKLYEE
jgi:tellurite resistance protein